MVASAAAFATSAAAGSGLWSVVLSGLEWTTTRTTTLASISGSCLLITQCTLTTGGGWEKSCDHGLGR